MHHQHLVWRAIIYATFIDLNTIFLMKKHIMKTDSCILLQAISEIRNSNFT